MVINLVRSSVHRSPVEAVPVPICSEGSGLSQSRMIERLSVVMANVQMAATIQRRARTSRQPSASVASSSTAR